MRADGSEFPAELTVTRTGLPEVPAFTGYIRDITDRQRAERDLIASRARLVTAFDAARQRVTRDLHDGAQQRFVSTIINLQLAQQKWDTEPPRARELLDDALSDARRGTDEVPGADRRGDPPGDLDLARPCHCPPCPGRKAPRPGPAPATRAQASGPDRGERLFLLL